MSSLSLPDPGARSQSPDDGPIADLLLAWQQGQQPDLEEFIARRPDLSASELASLVRIDLEQRWLRPKRRPAEDYLARFPSVSSDVDLAVDVIYAEYLARERRGEHPEVAEYERRFPAYASVLVEQIWFHRALEEVDTDGQVAIRSERDAATAPSAVQSSHADARHEGALDSGRAAEDGAVTSRVPGPAARAADGFPIGFSGRGSSLNREVQSLLRQRLRLCAVISTGGFLLYLPILWPLLSVSGGTALYLAVTTGAAFIGLLLSTSRPFSLRALRWMEIALFLGLLSYFGYQHIQFVQSGFHSALALDRWLGAATLARGMSWPWAVTMITYGILIPNTARRCLAIVGAMVISFVVIAVTLAFTSPALRESTAAYALTSITDMLFAGAIAIFGAYRIATLQQAASESRRLGPYRLVKRLGAGGMGEVYLAEHALLRRPCALKLIRPERVGDQQSLSRFEREVQTMATLTHANTARVYDYGLAADGTFYYAMEFLPGLSLQELVDRYGPLAPARAVYLLRQVCGALHEAHGVGFVHRDIKPANILVCHTVGMHDVAKLLDFGLVRVQRQSDDDSSLTDLRTIAGTPAFMSPEQVAGARQIDPRSDIYSLGAVAYCLLTGRPPFVHATSVETMAAHLNSMAVPPADRQSRVPADLESIVLRCLQKDPAQRFADVASLDEALARTTCAGDWSRQAAAQWWREFGDAAKSSDGMAEA